MRFHRDEPLLGGALDSIDTYTVEYIAKATCNAAYAEESRRRNCVLRVEDVDDSDCDCWACQRYGLEGYADFQLHPDGHYPERYLTDGKCWCWVCSMGG